MSDRWSKIRSPERTAETIERTLAINRAVVHLRLVETDLQPLLNFLMDVELDVSFNFERDRDRKDDVLIGA